MTYANLRAALKALCPDTYRRAAPRGLTRCIVTSRYGAELIRGDDRSLLRLRKIQIDVYFQDEDDALPDRVEDLLDALDQPYEVIDEIYDDDLALFRVLLQTEVTR